MRETKKWLKQEEDFIINNYTDMSDEEIGLKLGRTFRAVRTKRQRLGLFLYFQEQATPIKNEKWVTYCDNLEVSNKGRVRKDKIKYLRATVHKSGYVIVSINGKNKYLHVVVWEAFNGKIEDGYEIDHKDCNKLNNNLYNLEKVTHKENMQRACDNGCFKHLFGR